MARWTSAAIPDQSGKTAVVTGASSGIGAEAALAMAQRGARVILGVRDEARGNATRARILRRAPDAEIIVSLLDLASLGSIEDFAARCDARFAQIDLLLNNAGLGLQASRAVTSDGFERQFGTNHLGHFALTGRLVPALLRAPAPRVVTIASIAHRRGRIDLQDLQGTRRYNGSRAYSQSKLANIMFACELARRAGLEKSNLVSVAAHPGISSTGFIAATGMSPVKLALADFGFRLFGQDPAQGALPGLYAATMPDVRGGQYWGPDGLLELRGAPGPAQLAVHARDQAMWQRLWTASERLTGVVYPPLG